MRVNNINNINNVNTYQYSAQEPGILQFCELYDYALQWVESLLNGSQIIVNIHATQKIKGATNFYFKVLYYCRPYFIKLSAVHDELNDEPKITNLDLYTQQQFYTQCLKQSKSHNTQYKQDFEKEMLFESLKENFIPNSKKLKHKLKHQLQSKMQDAIKKIPKDDCLGDY